MTYKIELRDFPVKETYVYLDWRYKNFLLENSIKKFGSQRLLAEYLDSKLNWRKLKQTTISSWLKADNLRLDVIYELCKTLNVNLNEKKIMGLKGAQTSIMVFNPKLPIILNASLSGLIANLYCDGSIDENNSFTSEYINTCKELREQIKKYFLNSVGKPAYFSEKEYKFKHKKNVGKVRIPSFVIKALNKKFKLNDDKIPKPIINSNNKIKSFYLRSVFDDEGTVHKEHGQIKLKMKPRSYVNDVKAILEENFHIKCSEIALELKQDKKYYYFTISGQYNLRRFYNLVGFTHPKKLERLKRRLSSYKENNYGYGARNYVLNVLEKSPKTADQIAKIIKRDKRTIQHHLNNLKKDSLISSTKIKRKFVYEYLWSLKNEI